jgi:hypothetical protein
MKVVVTRGCIDAPDTDPAVRAGHRRLVSLGPMAARTNVHQLRRARVGEIIELCATDAKRLVELGVVRALET